MSIEFMIELPVIVRVCKAEKPVMVFVLFVDILDGIWMGVAIVIVVATNVWNMRKN